MQFITLRIQDLKLFIYGRQIELDKFPPVIHPMVKINPVNNKNVYFISTKS